MKVKFIKNNAIAVGLSYGLGEEAELTDEMAKTLIKDGFCIEVEEPKVESDLPADLPHRDKLIAAGVTSWEELKEISQVQTEEGSEPDDKQLIALKGIGEKSAHDILAFIHLQ